MKAVRWALAVALCFEIAYFLYDQTNNIVVTTPLIRDTMLAGAFGTARVAQISDLHIAGIGAVERNLIAAIGRIDPSVIFVTGDLVADNRGIDACIEVFRRIGVGRTVIVVLGNNDFADKEKYVDTDRLFAGIKRAGAHVLINRSLLLTVRHDGEKRENSVYVAGVNDNFTWRDDIFKATEAIPPDARYILLAHAPNIIERIHTERVCLILSGHTHGGQIALPWLGAVVTNTEFRNRRRLTAGLYTRETKLYVNRGIGTVVLPVRMFARPEITVFRFRRG